MKITWVLTQQKVRGRVVPKYYIKEYYESEVGRNETVPKKQVQSRGEIPCSFCLDQQKYSF